MNLIWRFALPSLLLFGSEAQASRVVYHELSLAELVRASDTIVVMEKTAGFGVLNQMEKNGCVSQRWPLRVHKVLKTGPGGIADGQSTQVIVNVVALRGCGFLKQNLMVSMVVDGYGPQGREQPQDPPQRFIAFLRPTANGYELAAINGIESESRLAQVVELIQP